MRDPGKPSGGCTFVYLMIPLNPTPLACTGCLQDWVSVLPLLLSNFFGSQKAPGLGILSRIPGDVALFDSSFILGLKVSRVERLLH